MLRKKAGHMGAPALGISTIEHLDRRAVPHMGIAEIKHAAIRPHRLAAVM
jgi:hypothetical protein